MFRKNKNRQYNPQLSQEDEYDLAMLIFEHLKVEPEDIDYHTVLFGKDWIAKALLLLRIEDQFRVRLEDPKDRIRTLGDLCEAVKSAIDDSPYYKWR